MRHWRSKVTLATMYERDIDDPMLAMIESVARDVLAQIGDDPDARFQFFKRLFELAKEITHVAAPEASTTRQ